MPLQAQPPPCASPLRRGYEDIYEIVRPFGSWYITENTIDKPIRFCSAEAAVDSVIGCADEDVELILAFESLLRALRCDMRGDLMHTVQERLQLIPSSGDESLFYT